MTAVGPARASANEKLCYSKLFRHDTGYLIPRCAY